MQKKIVRVACWFTAAAAVIWAFPWVRDACQGLWDQHEAAVLEEQRAAAEEEARLSWDGYPYLCSNAPRPAAREIAGRPLAASPMVRSPAEIQWELGIAIEASAVQESYRCGSWLLVELSPRIVALTVELRAATDGLTRARYADLLQDARQRLERDGTRVFFARVHGESWVHVSGGGFWENTRREECDGVAGAPYVLLENQRGEHGRLVEATPGLREHRYSATYHGVLVLEDVVADDDATYTVAFRSERGETDDYGRSTGRTFPGDTFARFTFDASHGRVLLALASVLPAAPYAGPPPNTVEDSNGDGFSVSDAINVFGSVISAVDVLIGLAAI